MKKSGITLLLVLAAVIGHGAKQDRDFADQSKTRISQIAAMLAPTNGVYGRPLAAGRYQKLMARGIPDCSDAKYLMFTDPASGNRSQYDSDISTLGEMIDVCTFAARNGDAAARERLVKIIRQLCGMKSWIGSAHDPKLTCFHGQQEVIDLYSSAMAFRLARMLFYLEGELPAADVAELRAQMERRIFNLYLAACQHHGPMAGTWWFWNEGNWCAVCHAGVVQAALAYYPDAKMRATFIEGAERAMPHFLRSFLDDGYCTEGMGYWNYGFGNFLELASSVRTATGGKLDLSRLPRAKTAMEYSFKYILTRDMCPVFADGGGGHASERNNELGIMFWPDLKETIEGKLPKNSLFPDAKIYIGRGEHLQFGIKGGNNADCHNHNDLGSWTLLADGVEVAGDPGGEPYTARTFSKDRYVSKVLNSYGHPVPVVNGELQGTGRQYAADIVSTNFTENVDEFVIDLTRGYPSLTEKKLGKVLRKVAFKRGSRDQVLIADEFDFKKPLDFETAFITYSDVERAADNKSFTLTKDRVRVQVQVGVKGSDKWQLVEEMIENPGARRPVVKRLAIRFTEPLAKGTVGWRVSYLPQ